MAINTIPISRRTAGYDRDTTANGSYTLPKYAFIPHPSLQQLSRGTVQSPSAGGLSAQFIAPPVLQRGYPSVMAPNVYGIRMVNLKTQAT